MAPRTAIVIYSLYHHVTKLAVEAKAGIEAAGGKADIFQVSETLPAALLEKLHAPPKKDFPIVSNDVLVEYDAFLFGFPTRYASMPSQFRTFLDGTGALFAQGKLTGKPFGMFVSTASSGSQETTIQNSLGSFFNLGMPFIPLGFSHPGIGSIEEVHGGSPLGAGTYAAGDGSREPTKLELEIAKHQGEFFQKTIQKF